MHDAFKNAAFPITRENAARLIADYIDAEELLLNTLHEIPREYDDIRNVSYDARYGVELAALCGIMDGDEKGNFAPHSLLTRSEADELSARLASAEKSAKHSYRVLSAFDLINSPFVLYSNMTSGLCDKGTIPTLHLTPYSTHSTPWYVGIDAAASNAETSSLCWLKICLRTEMTVTPVLKITSPVYSGELTAYSVDDKDGCITLIFNIKKEILALRRANITVSPVCGDTKVKSRLHLKSVNGRYLRIALYPFGNAEDAGCELVYIGLFADKDDCVSYDPVDDDVHFKGRDEFPHIDCIALDDNVEQMYKKEMYSRIDRIKNSKSELLPEDITGTCYFISSVNGDDSNDGLTPQTAWRSVTKLVGKNDATDSIATYKHIVKPGDGVFFERGSVFNSELKTRYSGNYAVEIRDGVDYGAYGEGEKPVFTNCMDYDGSRNWSATEYKNVWRLDDRVELPQTTEYRGYSDIGNIIVIARDGTVGHGIKVLANDPEDPFNGEKTVDIGNVTNGFEIFKSGGVELYDPGCLKHELEYIHDWESGYVYMYCSKGNPSEVYDKVILAKRGACFFEGSDSVIDNIAFKYIGTFGISVTEAKDLVIKNCTFEWIGGAIQGGTTVYGGGIQNWNNCDRLHIIRCYADQMLDAAFSTQGGDPQGQTIMNDVVIEDCVAVNTNSSVELWNYAKDNLLCNVSVKNNFFGYAGYHFGNRKVLKDACILQLGICPGQVLENVVYEKNINMFASSACYWARPFLCRGDTNGTALRDNIYLLSNKKMFMITSKDFRNNTVHPERYHMMLDEENIEALRFMGIDRGSKFYIKDDFLFECEMDGVYAPPYWNK